MISRIHMIIADFIHVSRHNLSTLYLLVIGHLAQSK